MAIESRSMFELDQALRAARSGKADETLPAESFWIYRVQTALLALKNEHADNPTIVFYKQYPDEQTAIEALLFLRNAAGEKELETLGINRELTDKYKQTVEDEVWLSIEEAFYREQAQA
jgi:hypothetical protein